MTSLSNRTRRLRILILSYYCPPAGGPAVPRLEMLLRHLPPEVEATILTATPEDYEAFSPLRMPLDEQRFAPSQGVHRIAAGCPYGLFRLLARLHLYGLVRWFHCPDVARRWARAASQLAEALHARKPFDAIFTIAAPYSVALAGRNCARQLGIAWVSDFGDLWADYLRGAWPTRFHHRYEQALEKSVVSEATATVMWTPGSREKVLRKYPFLDPGRVQVVTAGFEPTDFPSASQASAEKFVIAYTGVFCGPEPPEGRLRRLVQGRAFRPRRTNLDTDSPIVLIRAMELVNDKRLEFRCIGPTGAQNLKLFQESPVRDQIQVMGYCGHRDALAELARSDTAYLCLTTILSEARNEQVPQKTFEYMGARKPVLAPIQEGDAKDFLARAGTGIFTPVNDARALASALGELIQAKFAGRPAVTPCEEFIRQFEWSRLAARLFQIIESAASGRPTACAA